MGRKEGEVQYREVVREDVRRLREMARKYDKPREEARKIIGEMMRREKDGRR